MPSDANKYLAEKPDLNEILLSWESPSHPYKKRSRLFFQTVAAFTLLLVVIVFFLREFLLIGVILSISFVAYVINSVPPINLEHKIMLYGFDHAGRTYRWNELMAFWFETKLNQQILVIQTHYPFQPQIRAVVTGGIKDKIKTIIGKHLLFVEKPPKSFVDKISDWAQGNLPLEART